MRISTTTKRVAFGSFLLGTTFLVSPALAQNKIDVQGATGVTATNNNQVDATIIIPGPATITNATPTVAGVIGATAAGASGTAGIDQTVSNTGPLGLDLSTVPANTVLVSGAQGVTGVNTAAVNSHLELNTLGSSVSTGASIAGGVSNSIMSQAIGASGSASISSRFDNVLTFGSTQNTNPNTVTITHDVIATNTGAVSANPGALDTISGGATIANGVSNSISGAAIGAAASASITQSVSNSTSITPAMNLTELPNNAIGLVNITATNNAPVIGNLTVVGNTLIGGGVGLGGVANSVSAQAVGASAGASITSQFADVTTVDTNVAVQTNAITTSVGSISATNGSATGSAVTSNLNLGQPSLATSTTITGGIGNSINSSAIGSSGLASITQTASFTSTNGAGMKLGALPSNTVTIGSTVLGGGNISSTNGPANAPINANLTIAGTVGSVTSITGGVANSISAQGIGALAGATITQHINNVAH